MADVGLRDGRETRLRVDPETGFEMAGGLGFAWTWRSGFKWREIGLRLDLEIGLCVEPETGLEMGARLRADGGVGRIGDL